MQIRNIIFDLGGVLLNIDFNKTSAAFTALGIKNFDDYFTQFHADPLFKKLELGGIPGNSFFDELRSATSITADNHAIINAWNSMLLDFPGERIDRLKELKADYRLFLFSNTNAIHHQAFHQAFHDRFGFNMDELFEKAYYSHMIGHRKPDPASFLFVINDSQLIPGETAFIDDTMPNVEAARDAGLIGIHVPPGKSLLEVLDENL